MKKLPFCALVAPVMFVAMIVLVVATTVVRMLLTTRTAQTFVGRRKKSPEAELVRKFFVVVTSRTDPAGAHGGLVRVVVWTVTKLRVERVLVMTLSNVWLNFGR